MTDSEEVVVRLRRLRESGHPFPRSEVCELVQASGEELVGVALVADIKEEAVVSEIKDAVHRDGEFDNSEVWREVSAGSGDLVDDRCADLGCQLLKLRDGHLAELGWGCVGSEQGHLRVFLDLSSVWTIHKV